MSMHFDIQSFSKAVCNDKRTLEMFRNLVNNAYVRVINYHNTDLKNKERFDQEIAYFSRHFSPVRPEDLDTFFETKKWPLKKPGLIPAVYDGFRNQYDTLLPILDKYSFTGWFFLPAFFPDVPAREQIKYAASHDMILSDTRVYPDGRVAMSWQELRELASRHVICCHTGSHYKITRLTPDADMRRELVEAKRHIEEKTGAKVSVFAWSGGEEYLYNLKAHKFFEQAGYRYVVSDLKMEKIR